MMIKNGKKALYDNSRKSVHRELKKIQDDWYSNKVDEIQSYAGVSNIFILRFPESSVWPADIRIFSITLLRWN